ncbi:MAG: SPOR domain-containing protein [Leptolyngbyaceae cyanobacterium CRU_2_3]|nr:SPOR domain-containing protein [Leptolyngbyaceae cyanobacterium CRU_2_3]
MPAIAVQAEPPVEPVPAYQPAPPVEPVPAYQPPQSAPVPETSRAVAPTPDAAAVLPRTPAPGNLYHVGVDYSGDSSLQQARSAVPDAYVRNLPSGSAKVQMGAFSNEAAAQERVQELQQQGIAAQIYQP